MGTYIYIVFRVRYECAHSIVLLLQLTCVIIGMAFFTFAWTLLFLAYVCFLELLECC